jgi:hypothetical protein
MGAAGCLGCGRRWSVHQRDLARTMTDAADFRQSVNCAFPPAPFHGRFLSREECNDGIELRRELPRKHGDEIPTAFVDSNANSPALLEQAVARVD